jgi:hypothetical protein
VDIFPEYLLRRFGLSPEIAFLARLSALEGIERSVEALIRSISATHFEDQFNETNYTT